MTLGGKLRGHIRLFGAAHAGTRRVAALRHEPGDDPVEHHAVIKAFIGKARDPLDMLWCQIRPKLDHHITGIERQGQGGGLVGHVCLLKLQNGLLKIWRARLGSNQRPHA